MKKKKTKKGVTDRKGRVEEMFFKKRYFQIKKKINILSKFIYLFIYLFIFFFFENIKIKIKLKKI